MGFISTGRQLGKTLKNASRLRDIVSVFAKHGFHNLAERIKLGRFLLERLNSAQDLDRYSTAERVRMAFEELGPTFIKLGQVLASRPDLVPQSFVDEFSKLHDQVQQLDYETVCKVLELEFGANWKTIFIEVEAEPLGAASIGQVHRAKLSDGSSVVIKIQRPGISQKISDDLSVLYFLANLLETYVEETRPFNPTAIVDEYFKTLQLETNFVVEANNLQRVAKNLESETNIKIPTVYWEYTTSRVLTMEAIDGRSLSQKGGDLGADFSTSEIIKTVLRAYLKMVFVDGLFHGDLHSGNILLMPSGKVGLIDLGVVGRINHRTKQSIASMLLALSKEDYDRIAYEYLDLAPFDERIDIDVFAKELRDLIAPYYGLSAKNINVGRLLLQTSSIAARNNVKVPSELMLFFKSLVAVEGLGRRIDPAFDFLSYSMEFASELIQQQYEPGKMSHEMNMLVRESKSLLQALPRQLTFWMRKINSPDFHSRISWLEADSLKKSVESSFNLLFLGLIIGALLLSSSLMVALHPTAGEVPHLSIAGYALSAIFGALAFFNFIKK